MPSGVRREIDPNHIFTSNSGPYKIIEELPSTKCGSTTIRHCLVEFIETGTRVSANLQSAFNGNIKDPYGKTILGVACLGRLNGKHSKREYDIWFHMISRCYNPKDAAYNMYGGVGVTVYEPWLCFENFLKDLPRIPGYNDFILSASNTYAFDKDYKCIQLGINPHIYSPGTCMFLTKSDNSRYVTKNNTSSPYKGVYATQYGTYQSSINVNGTKYFIGTFSNEIAAANAYIHYAKMYGAPYPSREENYNLPYMNFDTAMSYRNGGTCIYRGVSRTAAGTYTADFTVDGKLIHIGTFDSPEYAARAYLFYANAAGINLGANCPNRALEYIPIEVAMSHQNNLKKVAYIVED